MKCMPGRRHWETIAEGSDASSGRKKDPLRLGFNPGGDVLYKFSSYEHQDHVWALVPAPLARALDSGHWSRGIWLDFLDYVIYPALHWCMRRRGRREWGSGAYWERCK